MKNFEGSIAGQISLFNQLEIEMESVSGKNDKVDARTCNFLDDELILKELCIKCHSLKTQKMKMLQIRENLSVLNEKNEIIYKSLLRMKNDYELYKSNLYRTLYTLKVSTDKQKILSKKKLNELYSKQKVFEEYYKVSPCKLELDKLTSRNRSLETEWENKYRLFKLTKKQHGELKSLIIETFKKKVCEFCDIVLRLKAFNGSVNW